MARQRLWTRDYLLLWQGQLVSALGDVAYEVALGFWILAVTGSTGLMGTLMAASMLPRVLVAPFAGVLVDRSDRKWLIVAMDALRGVAVVLVGLAAISGMIKVWMVFAAGIIIGAAAAFFNPSVLSAIPDIVSRERLVQANSFFSMIRAGSAIFGNALGGILYSLIGAPLLFLMNGLSYLFSSASELFIRVPPIRHERQTLHFWTDMREGLSYVWSSRGLRFFLMATAALNFFAMIGIVLILPLFRRTPELGPARYGILMAAFTVGTLAGMGMTAAVNIPARRRLRLFALSMVIFIVAVALFPVWLHFPVMLALAVVGGFFNAVVNVLIQSVVQLAVQRELRGKVMGLLEALSGGLTPLGMAVGGLLGEVLPLRPVISGAFVMMGVVIFPQLGARYLREFLAGPGELQPTDSQEAPGA